MERYLNVTDARKELLDLVEQLKKGDRVVLTKRGQPRAVLVNFERYALLEDLAWVLQDPGRQAALQQAWNELQRGKVIRPSKHGPLTVRYLRELSRRPSRRRAKA
ncbi:MAG: type II toxin-antitoxin system Phd/YefM family antitoxin [Deltaproteobacteria bacterium]|nr:type II toxin-antitoxin system Phd/YefM family antitoxin [Deltaproteobacteria bacterium]MBI2348186.1 type II toxin-antitoxin system Phd/YefM family antitoxin [Deltaproteobacteria bacterium]MBI2539236.1 type II toxin-antitoxin system Phd/YefM family antitoxin [Deltaproteobacteria bacterium]MBI2992197.1 type II toxin-antitoxin system Phd/YefM family antitoxin [Deltaproteobacteria bacterium]MBI3061820.1 type II toxin-antitoxin system Phd/YefM family antitoxin [Deltaproteobacteria bacterium]